MKETTEAAPFPPGTRLFCFGFGYSAAAVARLPAAGGVTVAGTTRDVEKAERLHTAGIAAYPFDGTEPVGAGALDGTTHVLVSAPPDGGGDPVLRHHRSALAALRPPGSGISPPPGSTATMTAAGLTKARPCGPPSSARRRRVQAELDWQRFADSTGFPSRYSASPAFTGPGAACSTSCARARRGASTSRVICFRRIHVDDIANVLAAAMRAPDAGPVFNVCDDEPAAQADVVAYGAELLGMSRHPWRRSMRPGFPTWRGASGPTTSA